MEKITFSELCNRFYKHNEGAEVTTQWGDRNPLLGVIVFKSSNWPDSDYTLESRSYVTRSDEKYFVPGMGGNSMYADCLDKSERCVRLDWYVNRWKIDYCYVED